MWRVRFAQPASLAEWRGRSGNVPVSASPVSFVRSVVSSRSQAASGPRFRSSAPTSTLGPPLPTDGGNLGHGLPVVGDGSLATHLPYIYRVILNLVKTAISVPDETYDRVERVAKKHGMNRSQFYAAAADRLADELESADLTAAIDAVIDAVARDESTEFAVAAGQALLATEDEEW